MKNYNIRDTSNHIQVEILHIFHEMQPRLTCRQIFYALTVRGVIPKSEKGYRQTLYQLKSMREDRTIPYGWIADNTRWQIKPDSYHSLEDALDHWQASYRRDLWNDQFDYVEIWVEKDALAGVISPITSEYDVPLYVSRGYSSMTFLYEAADYLNNINRTFDKSLFIYQFGDFDPSGVDAANKVEEGLLKHGADVYFKRVAVTLEQIESMNLPTRETKRSDPRSRIWGNKPSAELDAIPAPVLRKMVRDCILNHIDSETLAMSETIERLERETLADFRNNLVLGPNSDLAPWEKDQEEGDDDD